MTRSLETFPVFPHCAETFIADLTLETFNMQHRVKDLSTAAPLANRMKDFVNCVGRLDEVLELEALGTNLGGRCLLVCERVDAEGSLGTHWEGVPLPTLSPGDTGSLVAIAASYSHRARHLSRVDVLLHEIAHIEFQEHDLWFAALLNWQRLRCGLPCLPDFYDVRDEKEAQGFRPPTWNTEAAMELAHEIAMIFRRAGSLELVTYTVRQLEMESWNMEDVESLRFRAIELSSATEWSASEGI